MPIVPISFSLSEKLYKIECRAHAKNIVHDSKMSLGSITFQFQTGKEPLA